MHERRVRLPTGLDVEFGITSPSWAGLPLDQGTRRVLADGAVALHGPDYLLTPASHAAQMTRSLHVDHSGAPCRSSSSARRRSPRSP